MADLAVIRSYLVSLGFRIDNNQLRQFNDALRNISATVERATTGPQSIASSFVKTGAVIAGVLTAVAVGTVGLMERTASADLGYALFARRMFMTTDAARSMKIATDALGVSLEDIVWGPRELAERFQQLVTDQQGMGGEAYETQMRHIRDVTFEFTRMRVELKLLSMSVVKDLSIALFGDEDALLVKLRDFNDWFIKHLPAISRVIAEVIRNVLRAFGSLAKVFRAALEQGLEFFRQVVATLTGNEEMRRGALSLRLLLEVFGAACHQLLVAVDATLVYMQEHALALDVALGSAVGAVVGVPAGAALGAAVGTYVGGPLGTLLGGLLGSVLGSPMGAVVGAAGGAGWWAGGEFYDWTHPSSPAAHPTGARVGRILDYLDPEVSAKTYAEAARRGQVPSVDAVRPRPPATQHLGGLEVNVKPGGTADDVYRATVVAIDRKLRTA